MRGCIPDVCERNYAAVVPDPCCGATVAAPLSQRLARRVLVAVTLGAALLAALLLAGCTNETSYSGPAFQRCLSSIHRDSAIRRYPSGATLVEVALSGENGTVHAVIYAFFDRDAKVADASREAILKRAKSDHRVLRPYAVRSNVLLYVLPLTAPISLWGHAVNRCLASASGFSRGTRSSDR
jgi:hypothetical protein